MTLDGDGKRCKGACTSPLTWNAANNRCEDQTPCPEGQRRETAGAACTQIPEPPNQQRAIDECNGLHSQAQAACNGGAGDPRNPGATGGLQQLCEQYRRTNRATADANIEWANNCNTALQTCKNKCQQFATQFSGAAATLNSQANSCQNLQARVRQSGLQSGELLSAADLARLCAQNTAQDYRPNSQGPGSPNPNLGPGGGGLPGGGAPPGAQPANNPYQANSQSSYLQRNVAAEAVQPKNGFEQPGESAAGEFNINEPAPNQGNRPGANFYGAGPRNENIDKIPGRGGAQGTVSNNSGGQIPGGSSGFGAASLPPKRGGGTQGPTVNTDILNGFQGGGGGATGSADINTAGSGFDESGSRGGGYGRGPQPQEQDVDLKKYLPGGSLAANGRHQGGYASASLGIHGPAVNLWNRINVRIIERCRLGRLIDCR